MVERSAKTLADAFEPTLKEKLGEKRRRGASPITLRCESTAEAAQVTAELKKRGWKAQATKAIALATSEVWIGVRVTGQKLAKAGVSR